MTEDEKREFLHEEIRTAHYGGTLVRLIGDALRKDAVLLMLIDVVGRFTMSGDNRATTENSKRHRILLFKIRSLLQENMDRMMKEAGKEAKEQG